MDILSDGEQPGDVIAGVEDDQDVRVALMPLPGLHQPFCDLADLGRGYARLVIRRAQPHRVQHRRPQSAARLQRRDEGVRPARDHLRVCPCPARRRGRTSAPGWRQHLATTSCSRPPRAGSAHLARPAAAGTPATTAAARYRSGRRSPRRRPHRARGGAPAPATARPPPAPARRRTAPNRPAQTAHPPGRSSTGTTRRGSPPAGPGPHRFPPGPRPRTHILNATATANVFKFSGRNPKMIAVAARHHR